MALRLGLYLSANFGTAPVLYALLQNGLSTTSLQLKSSIYSMQRNVNNSFSQLVGRHQGYKTQSSHRYWWSKIASQHKIQFCCAEKECENTHCMNSKWFLFIIECYIHQCDVFAVYLSIGGQKIEQSKNNARIWMQNAHWKHEIECRKLIT